MTQDSTPVTPFRKVVPGHRTDEEARTPGTDENDVAVRSPDGLDSSAPDRLVPLPSADEPVADRDDVVPVTRADVLVTDADRRSRDVGTDWSLLPDAADLRAQWQDIQFRFVDDPRASVAEAADVVAGAAARLEAAIQERLRGLRGGWGDGNGADTESLRESLRMYRSFLFQLTNAGRAE
jgi:hypothetical protein